MGGLIKRKIATVAKLLGKPWYNILKEAEDDWNATYVSELQIGPPDKFYASNFDKVVDAVYKYNPTIIHALYSVGKVMTEEEALELFKFRPGQKVLVSLKYISKIIRNPISSKYYSELRHMSYGKAKVVARRLGFDRESRGLVKMYSIKLKSGPQLNSVYEAEMKPDKMF